MLQAGRDSGPVVLPGEHDVAVRVAIEKGQNLLKYLLRPAVGAQVEEVHLVAEHRRFLVHQQVRVAALNVHRDDQAVAVEKQHERGRLEGARRGLHRDHGVLLII